MANELAPFVFRLVLERGYELNEVLSVVVQPKGRVLGFRCIGSKLEIGVMCTVFLAEAVCARCLNQSLDTDKVVECELSQVAVEGEQPVYVRELSSSDISVVAFLCCFRFVYEWRFVSIHDGIVSLTPQDGGRVVVGLNASRFEKFDLLRYALERLAH